MTISIEFEKQCEFGYKQVDTDIVKMMLGFSACDYIVVLVALFFIERFNNKCIALYIYYYYII